MASSHLVHKLKEAAAEADIRLIRRSVLRHQINGHLVRCAACYISGVEGARPYIEVALRAKDSADALVHVVIHELLHYIGYNEEAVEGGLDNACFQSWALREVVAMRLLNLLVFPSHKDGEA